MSHSWGYASENGPATWSDNFPEAGGSRQSPVDIDTSAVVSGSRGRSYQPLSWSYVPSSVRSLLNSGHGWKVDVDGEDSELTGGPLQHVHKLEQFHCHWGSSSDKGSEHTIDGTSYAAELHLVHWNCGKYATFSEAASQPDGLAVLGILLKVGDSHPEIEKITELIPQIPHKGQTVNIRGSIDIAQFLPVLDSDNSETRSSLSSDSEDSEQDCETSEKGKGSRKYWTYLGSLTTPPCSEVVTWILFKEPIEVSEQQLDVFRSMRCYSEEEECPCDELKGQIINNFRPPVALGDRVLNEFIF